MLHIPTKLQEKYNFLIKEPHGLDQVSCSKLLMTRLLENGLKECGEYSIIWDASYFASGIYYVHIAAGSSVETQKVMLIK